MVGQRFVAPLTRVRFPLVTPMGISRVEASFSFRTFQSYIMNND